MLNSFVSNTNLQVALKAQLHVGIDLNHDDDVSLPLNNIWIDQLGNENEGACYLSVSRQENNSS